MMLLNESWLPVDGHTCFDCPGRSCASWLPVGQPPGSHRATIKIVRVPSWKSTSSAGGGARKKSQHERHATEVSAEANAAHIVIALPDTDPSYGLVQFHRGRINNDGGSGKTQNGWRFCCRRHVSRPSCDFYDRTQNGCECSTASTKDR